MRFALWCCNDFFFLWLFLLLCTKPFKEKERCDKFHHVVVKRNKAKQQQTELWSNATMQQVVLYVFAVISNVTFFGKTYTNDNPLFVRKLKDG